MIFSPFIDFQIKNVMHFNAFYDSFVLIQILKNIKKKRIIYSITFILDLKSNHYVKEIVVSVCITSMYYLFNILFFFFFYRIVLLASRGGIIRAYPPELKIKLCRPKMTVMEIDDFVKDFLQ